MTAIQHQQQLGKTLWAIADDLRGAMNADDFAVEGCYHLQPLMNIKLLVKNTQSAARLLPEDEIALSPHF